MITTDILLALILVFQLLIWLQGNPASVELKKKPNVLKMKAWDKYGKLVRRIKKWRTD
jgi:hypothetical protein